MPFTTWADEVTKAKNALANRNWDSYFVQSVENSREMNVAYTKLGNVTAFIEWLELKASYESQNAGNGAVFFITGGY